MSIEQLLAQNPDIILFLTSKPIGKTESEALIQSLQILPALKAVQQGHVGVISGKNLMGVGPNIINLVSQVREKGQKLLEAK